MKINETEIKVNIEEYDDKTLKVRIGTDKNVPLLIFQDLYLTGENKATPEYIGKHLARFIRRYLVEYEFPTSREEYDKINDTEIHIGDLVEVTGLATGERQFISIGQICEVLQIDDGQYQIHPILQSRKYCFWYPLKSIKKGYMEFSEVINMKEFLILFLKKK